LVGKKISTHRHVTHTHTHTDTWHPDWLSRASQHVRGVTKNQSNEYKYT